MQEEAYPFRGCLLIQRHDCEFMRPHGSIMSIRISVEDVARELLLHVLPPEEAGTRKQLPQTLTLVVVMSEPPFVWFLTFRCRFAVHCRLNINALVASDWA